MAETRPTRPSKRTALLIAIGGLLAVVIGVCGWVAVLAWRDCSESVAIVAPKPDKIQIPNGSIKMAPAEGGGSRLSASGTPPISVGLGTARVRPANLGVVPPLEEQRARLAGEEVKAPIAMSFPPEDNAPASEAGDAAATPAAALALAISKRSPKTDVQFIDDIECGTPLAVTEISPTHYAAEITTRDFRDWFMFRLHGVGGKTIRIDLHAQGIPMRNWASLSPVFTSASDLDAPATYACSEADSSAAPSPAWNMESLPSTQSQQWHYIANCWEPDSQTFCLAQHFDADDVCVAMRVPRPPRYNEQFFEQLSKNPYVKVITVGHSPQNQPLLMAKFGTGDAEAEKRKPCIVMYAGEHADEQDAMWVAQGAIEFLASDGPQAAHVRDKLTVLVIPTFDPAVSSIGVHSGIITMFRSYANTPESNAYANWFQQWVRAGNRLDVVFNMHNVQSAESPDIACALLEGNGARGKISFAFDQTILDGAASAGYSVNRKPWIRGWCPDRLGGWLSRRYGAIGIAYEVNSQASGHHLDLVQLKNLGASIIRASSGVFPSANGRALLANVDAWRKEWADSWAKYGAGVTDVDAIQSEWKVSNAAKLRNDPYDPKGEKWMN